MTPRLRSLAGLLVLAATTAYMAAATWGTWPDPRIDFGSQLYYPWRVAAGQRLYVDIAYFNGPLSQYFNAAAFALFGVGLRTLVWVNLAIFAGVLLLVRHLAGTAAAVVGALVFGFNQYVSIGNYNWVCPYTHEITHGVALGIAAVATVARWHRGGRTAWLAAAGVALGLCFLTKAEVFAPAAVAVAVGLAVGRPSARAAGSVLVPTVFVVFATFALLTTSIGTGPAGRAVVGSWPWVFDRRIGQIPFYRIGAGMDDKAGNLLAMAAWVGAYAAAGGVVLLLAHRRWRVAGAAAAVAAAGVMIGQWPRAVDVARPWPVLVAAVGAVAAWQARRGPMIDRPTWAVRATFAALALGLLAKMVLYTRVYHYGFALALPAAAVLIDAGLNWGPAWLGRRPGFDPRFARASFAAMVVAVVGVYLNKAHEYAAARTVVVGTGPDQFYATLGRGTGADAAWRTIDALLAPTGTLAVVPQGLMVNYMARRVDSVPMVNLMPPELISAGEATVLASLAAHPPDAVILTAEGFDGDALLLTEGHYRYAEPIVAWIRAHYEPDPRATLPVGFTLLRWRG